jgi:outer membrane lipase/esterase
MMTSGSSFGVSKLRQAGLKCLGALVFVVGPIGLISCGGGGTTHEPFVPSKIIALGDGISDITPGARYSVNAADGQIMTVIEQFVSSHGFSLTDTAVFTSTAKGNARVATTATFAPLVKTLKNQVADYLATNPVESRHMYVLSGGLTDLVEEYKKFLDAGQDDATMTANVTQAALDYVAIIQSLVDANVQRIVVIPPYNLVRSPWAQEQTDAGARLGALTRTFNDKLLSSLASMSGKVVLYAPMESSFDTIVLNPSSYALTNVSLPVCSTAANDAGNGIGIGTNQINSSLCTTATLTVTGTITALISEYAFADKVYPTPAVNRNLGLFIYNNVQGR